MRILFMGTPDFATKSLMALVNSKYDVCAVVTQPDKPKGRHMTLTPPPVKVFAEESNIKVYQPQSLKNNELMPVLDEHRPDLIVVVAYGKILPRYILQYPKYGCINIHASLLPKYRGAAPINWAIINGEKESGVTSMLLNEGMDTGDMLLKETVLIEDEDDAEILHDKLATVGADILIKTIDGLENNTIKPIKQDDSLATYAPMFNSDNTKIDFNKTAKEVYNFIRGLNPFPTAYTFYKGKILKIYKSSPVKGGFPHNIGEIFEYNGDLLIKCRTDAIKAETVLLAGSKKMSGRDFLRGNKL